MSLRCDMVEMLRIVKHELSEDSLSLELRGQMFLHGISQPNIATVVFIYYAYNFMFYPYPCNEDPSLGLTPGQRYGWFEYAVAYTA